MTTRISRRDAICTRCERPIPAGRAVVAIDGQEFCARCSDRHRAGLDALCELETRAWADQAWRIFTRLERAG